MSTHTADTLDEFLDRELCPNGCCHGILNPLGVCKECGTSASAHSSPSPDGVPISINPMLRQLCPDGGCIGILGPEGKCNECGQVGPDTVRDPRFRGMKAPDSAGASPPPSRTEPPPVEPQPDHHTDDEPQEFATRRLCPDGSCLGVIASNGTCPQCGHPA